jgi:hydroxymethylpyrimidine/phosphomethylpyrimidine kinase
MIRNPAPLIVVTVAESDSTGASGVQADLKTFAALGVYGTSAVTAITVRDIVGLVDVRELPAALVTSQIDAVLSDMGAAAVKTGMLPSRDTVEAVADQIRERGIENLVLDPVLPPGADTLAEDEDVVESLRSELVPLARVVTPNAREAGLLTGREVETLDDARTAAEAIVEMGADCAVVTGGRFAGPATDVMYDGTELRAFTAQRVETANDRGVGAAFSAAIAAGLANGLEVREAVSQAKKYVTGALRHALPIGARGTVNHFHEMRSGR